MPTKSYEAETWNIEVAERKRLNVMEMRCLRSTYMWSNVYGSSEK